MWCGTPVIALRSGGVTDQIKDGMTGFLCDALDEIREIIVTDKVGEIDPYECRRHVEEYFSKVVIVDDCDSYLLGFSLTYVNESPWRKTSFL